jgi:Cohesin domain
MKRFWVLAALAAGLSLQSVAAFADATITAAAVTAKPGGLAIIPVTLNADAKGISGVEFTITSTATPADAAALTVAVDAPSEIPSAIFDSNLDGGVFHAAAVTAQPFDGPVKVVTLSFQVPASAAAGTVYALKLTAKLNNTDGQPIAVKTQDGTITVQP